MKEGFPNRLTTPSAEAQTDALLARVPEELREKLEDKYASLGAEERLVAVRTFFEKRQAVLAERNSSRRERPSHVKVENVRPLAVARFIENLNSGEHTFLGSGRAGHVIASVRYPEVCYKVMLPTEELPVETNSIAEESDLQDEIFSLGEIAGVRAPRVHGFIEEDGIRAIRMERIEGTTLKEHIEGRESWPASFDADSFFNALSEYIDHLHRNGYHHRDLHPGNIMVDHETGLPRVIDFGASTHTVDAENAYRKTVVKSGQNKEIVLPSDIGALALMKQQVLLAQKGL